MAIDAATVQAADAAPRFRILVLAANDNVANALCALEAGATVVAGKTSVRVRDAIPKGHKIAVSAIAQGEPVVKYGHAIGMASRPIEAGEHVHVHNVNGLIVDWKRQYGARDAGRAA